MKFSARSKELIKTPEIHLLANREWRLRHLYWIKDHNGKRTLFQPNWAQNILLSNSHPCKIVLKARQLGITTFCCIDALDRILWEDGIQAGIIAHTLDDAQNIFEDKIKYPFEQLHPAIKKRFRLTGDSAKELSFAHGSAIRVGTSLRSSTNQIVHVSEFGKVCAKNPEKAREIVTGAFNTIHVGQSITVESTAEGKEGYFYDMVQKARLHAPISPLDFQFFFFPWWKHPEYSIGVNVALSQDLKDYFAKLSLSGIHLSDPQKWWYAKKIETQGEDMTREFPSTPEESFAASQEGYWYASYIKELHDSGRVTNVGYDRSLPVHTAWDLGQADAMSIWFFQVNRSDDINIIDFFQKSDTRLDQIAILLQQKKYNYGTHIWPHDAGARDRSGVTFVDQARTLGINGIVLEPHAFLQGISLVKTIFTKCWFDKTKCAEGLRLLENYKKRWSTSFGGWTSEAVHDNSSHCADSFRYLAAGVKRIVGNSGSLENDYSILRKFFGDR